MSKSATRRTADAANQRAAIREDTMAQEAAQQHAHDMWLWWHQNHRRSSQEYAGHYSEPHQIVED